MRKNFFFTLSMAIGFSLLASCSQEEMIQNETNSLDQQYSGLTHTIPEAEALANLNSFMKGSSESDTRSDDDRQVESIYPVLYAESNTRSGSQDSTLVYIANFENNAGYAILAGDERIPETVIAIIDEGTLDQQVAENVMTWVTSQSYQHFEDFPTTGDGFITASETGNEIYINPNTVNLYDASKGDTLCGNFSSDDEGAIDSSGKSIKTVDKTCISTSNLFTISMCFEYAIYTRKNDRNLHNFNPNLDGCIEGEVEPPHIYSKTETTDWITRTAVIPILPQFKAWHQLTPFNDFYPFRHKYLFFGHKRKAPAGCFPLAVAKIFTYFETPMAISYNGYTVDWSAIKNNISSSSGRTSVAALLACISNGCESMYFYKGTFTFPWDVTEYMRKTGYYNARTYRYSFDHITEMLDKSKPLIMYSIPNQYDLIKSHSWNVDGYKIKNRTVTVSWYVNGVLTDQSIEKQECKMVHCDFGWKGAHNGYYVDGVFQLNGEGAEIDFGSTADGHTNYDKYLHVLTY